jgi:hypothetical protein
MLAYVGVTDLNTEMWAMFLLVFEISAFADHGLHV